MGAVDAHAIWAEARRHVWAVRADFWDSFRHVLARGGLDVAAGDLPEAARPSRRSERQSRSTVAILPLHGLIMPRPSILSMLFGGGGGLVAFREALREAVASDEVDAIVLDIDSPGGSVALVEETAADVRAAAKVKPIAAISNVDAASAAYWIAAQASEVVSTPSGMVGSVGTFVLHEDFSGVNERLGIDPTYISAGRFKTEANPDEPLSDEAAEHLQSLVDQGYDSFVRDLAAGRGVPERTVRRGYGEGRMLTAQDALDAGMIDGIETLEQLSARALADDLGSSPRGASLNSSGEGRNLHSDEDRTDETGSARKSDRQVARHEDEALIDSIIAGV